MVYFKYYILLCSCFFWSGWGAQYAVREQVPVVVNVITDASGHIYSEMCSSQQVDVKQVVTLPSEWLSTGRSWLEKYRRLLAGCGLATAYGWVYERVLTLNAYFTSHSWSTWKEHLDLDRLAGVSKKELINELLLDIQQCHLNQANPRDSLSPLIAFLKVLDEEEKMIKEYLFLHKWTKMLLIGLTLPFIEAEVTYAYQRLARLDFVKQLFQEWAVEQNFIALTR